MGNKKLNREPGWVVTDTVVGVGLKIYSIYVYYIYIINFKPFVVPSVGRAISNLHSFFFKLKHTLPLYQINFSKINAHDN